MFTYTTTAKSLTAILGRVLAELLLIEMLLAGCGGAATPAAGPTAVPPTATVPVPKPVEPTQTTQPTQTKQPDPSKGNFPSCPSDLAGVLTAPLMEPKYIAALTPLGNINPPGHTSPVDHIYFATDYSGQIPLYAPADAWITRVDTWTEDDGTGTYKPIGYVVTYTVCQGLELDFANYADVIPSVKDALAKVQDPNCFTGIVKPGHEHAQGQCVFPGLYIPVTSGEQVGYVQVEMSEHGYTLPFEIWAANYNVPARSDVNWAYYNDNRYPHSFCLFDLYNGALKDQFDAKFGMVGQFKDLPLGTPDPDFVPRTAAPVCGQINQDVVGTIQGMWFAGAPDAKQSLEFQGKGLAFLHNNLDPTLAEISIGGTIAPQAGAIVYKPTHSGTVDREPSEVKSDGQVYCFNQSQMSWNIQGKVLVQLLNDYHLSVENQPGSCGAQEAFKTPTDYQR